MPRSVPSDGCRFVTHRGDYMAASAPRPSRLGSPNDRGSEERNLVILIIEREFHQRHRWKDNRGIWLRKARGGRGVRRVIRTRDLLLRR